MNLDTGKQEMSSDPTSKLDSEKLAILREEYANRDKVDQSSHRMIIEISAIAFSVLAGIVAFLASRESTSITPEVTQDLVKGAQAITNGSAGIVYWILPLVFIVPFALFIGVLFSSILNGYYLLHLEDEIAKISGIELFHFHRTESKGLYSLRTGSPGILAVYGVIFLASLGVYILLLLFCYSGIMAVQKEPPVWVTVSFWTLYSILPIVVYSAFKTAMLDTRNIYDAYMPASKKSDSMSGSKTTRLDRVTAFRFMNYALLPNPLNLVVKSPLFFAATVYAILLMHTPISYDFIWAIFLVWFCIEFMAKQSAYFWNDIRDCEKDACHPNNRSRAIPGLLNTVGKETLPFVKLLFMVRAILTFCITALLSMSLGLKWWLFAIILFIFVWQYLYDSWGKKGPVRRLIADSTGTAARGFAGALVAARYLGSYDGRLLVLISIWAVILSVVSLSCYWAAEATFNTKKIESGELQQDSIDTHFRLWFDKKGRLIQEVANMSLVPVGIILAVLFSHDNGTASPLAVAGYLIMGVALITVLFHIKLPKIMEVREETRLQWLSGVVLAFAIAWMWIPSLEHLFLLAIGVPLFVAVLYFEMSYEEMKMKNLLPRLKYLMGRVDQILFGKGSTNKHI